MARFNGIYPAKELTPSPCGILSVADVFRHTRAGYDERWVRGFDFEFESRPTVRLLDEFGQEVAELSDGEGLDRFNDINPFFIEVEDHNSAMGIVGDDRFARIKRQLEAATQKAVERELWEGLVAQADSTGNPYFRDGNADIPVTGGLTAIKALAVLEQAIGDSPTGTGGVIHMTRDVATILLGGSISYVEGLQGENKHLVTVLGTPVVVGSGYTGNGPDGDDATDTNKWMFATGPVSVHLGAPVVVNEDLGAGFDPSTNDLLIKANRPAAVYFDPSIYSAAQVTLP